MSVYDRPQNRIPAWVIAVPIIVVFVLIGAEIAYVSSGSLMTDHHQISQYRK